MLTHLRSSCADYGRKKRFVRSRWLWLLVAVLVSSCAEPAPADQLKIGFSQCTTGDAWRQAMLAGMKKELSLHPDVVFAMKDAHDNSALQRQQIQEFLKEDIRLVSKVEEP